MTSISIVGFGRFGKTLYRLLNGEFQINLYDRNTSVFNDVLIESGDIICKNIKDVYKSKVVFYCVPISAFEKVISSHSEYFYDHLLIDTLSVKVHPLKVFRKYLSGKYSRAILTHPMFGPDSSKNGFKGLKLVMSNLDATEEEYKFWQKVFKRLGIAIIEMSPRKHDRLAAKSQGVTHFIGRILEELGYSQTEIDTVGARKLTEVMEQTCNDTWDLFTDLQIYNPYTKEMRISFGKAYGNIFNKLIRKQSDHNILTIGIQGGKGSFNEEAIQHYLHTNNIQKYKIKYLYTTEKVLKNLYRGNIDIGQFAISNTLGGMVGESMRAMSKYEFEITEEFFIKIRHYLMKKKGTSFENINTIMAHPQVLKQCAGNLRERYPSYVQSSGEGDLVDTAAAAKALAEGKLDENTAILGPRGLADLYGFDVVDSDMQDDEKNFTTFLIAKRI